MCGFDIKTRTCFRLYGFLYSILHKIKKSSNGIITRMSDIKMVNISGSAVQDLAGNSTKRGKRNTKKNQSGGADEAIKGVSQVMNVVKGIESQSMLASQSASPNSNTWLRYPTTAPVPPAIRTIPSHIPTTPNQSAAPIGQYTVPTQSGGVKHVKVELKKKTSEKKVHLNPKKAEAPKTHLSKKHTTRKIRKVTLGVKSLHKRMTRAKKLHKEVKEMPLADLKQKLIKGGLIKENSKAPENILRQIAQDAEVVAKKAL